MEKVESPHPKLGACDGITGPLEAFWTGWKRQGLSATALERYATCPFQFFAAHVLGIRALEFPEFTSQVGSLEVGTLIHAILKNSVAALHGQAFLEGNHSDDGNPQLNLEAVAQSICQQFGQTAPVGYPLLWEVQQEEMLDLVSQILQLVVSEKRNGWEPIYFEEPITAHMVLPLSTGREEFVVTGQIDRVDWSSQKHAFRII